MATTTGNTLDQIQQAAFNKSAFFNPTFTFIFHDDVSNPLPAPADWGLDTGVLNIPKTAFSAGGLDPATGIVIKDDTKTLDVKTMGFAEATRSYAGERDLSFTCEYQELPPLKLMQAIYGYPVAQLASGSSTISIDRSGPRGTFPLRSYIIEGEDRHDGMMFVRITILPYCVVTSAPDETTKGDGNINTMKVEWQAQRDANGALRLEVEGGTALKNLAVLKGYTAAS